MIWTVAMIWGIRTQESMAWERVNLTNSQIIEVCEESDDLGCTEGNGKWKLLK